MSNKYDAIVIGSGIGGLTAAAILSKYSHKKVLILEQHYVIGGFTHEFDRQGFHWDVGLHYVGEIEEYYAPVIISDAGAFNTYTKLIPESYSIAYREEIKAFPKGMSLDAEWIDAKTPIENLYLTGTDVSGHGILGAALGGVVTAGVLNGSFGFFKIMSAIEKQDRLAEV
ncbi:MAG: NAD(P)-binding protein [Prochloraceae cyanobacterium]|nr:NAD(P)-binding protein [Prochloraceae cyanobacterium]